MNAERCLLASEALGLYHAARLYDASGKDSEVTTQNVGIACNSAKFLAAEAGYAACERAVSQMRSHRETPSLCHEQ